MPLPPQSTLVALGANLGPREESLKQALAALQSVMAVSAVSPVYETAPMYLVDQAPFLNLVARGHTDLSPEALLLAVKKIESRMGRVKSVRNGPRLIDIDIILLGEIVWQSDSLTIPHPRMRERAFVLQPAADIASEWIDPVTGRTIGDLFAALPRADHGGRRIDIDLTLPMASEDDANCRTLGGLA